MLALVLLSLAADIRVGIIGTDTSHATAFTKVLNDPASPEHIPGARVVAAFKGGSPDLESSANRVEGYATELVEKWKVEIVPDIASLCPKVDAILLESVDGRKHLPQFREAVKCGKPIFIDKPLASTYADAKEIARLAKQAGIPWWSSSSLRYADYVADLKKPGLQGVISWGPGPFDKTHQLDLSWYAVHPIEVLYTLMGTGCVEVTRIAGEAEDVVVGKWKDGRIGTVRALRPYGEFGAVGFFPKEIRQSPPKPKFSYAALLREVVKFFETKQPPVPNAETLEIFAFMDAAQRSKESGGKPAPLQ
jgi:hypothetical protein